MLCVFLNPEGSELNGLSGFLRELTIACYLGQNFLIIPTNLLFVKTGH